jgi:hypothetical protein
MPEDNSGGFAGARGARMTSDILAAIKAIEISPDTVLFIDRNQINLNSLLDCKEMPRCLIVTTDGPPNVEAISRERLKEILSTHT